MPAPPQQVGVEFDFVFLSNRDGSTISIYCTWIDAQHRFTLRVVNTSTQSTTLVVTTSTNTTLPVLVGPGETVYNGQNGGWGNMTYEQAISRYSISSIA